MTYRDEVNDAVQAAIDKVADGVQLIDGGKLRLVGVQGELRELILLGVKLGLAAAADEFSDETMSLSLHIRQRIGCINHDRVLQVTPELPKSVADRLAILGYTVDKYRVPESSYEAEALAIALRELEALRAEYGLKDEDKP